MQKLILKVLFHESTTTLAVGPSVIGPLDFSVVPRNYGGYTTSFWRINVVFCKDINISKSEQGWILLDPASSQYVYQSDKPLVSISGLGYFFTDALDSVGDFQIYIRSNKFTNDIPIAIVFSAGEKTETKFTLVMLSKKDGFYYKDINFIKGRIVPSDVEELMRNCRPLVYKN